MTNIILLFTIFIPFILATPTANPKRGFAMAYPEFQEDAVDVAWYHQWGPCGENPKCVPLSYGEPISNLKPTYNGFLLLFNEPNNRPPYGVSETVESAYQKYITIKQLYPSAKIILGNVTLAGTLWLQNVKSIILQNCGTDCLPYAWGIHAYIEGNLSPLDVEQELKSAHDLLGGTFWITEWADTNCSIENADALRIWMNDQVWIERWAWFTNRLKMDHTEEWFPPSWCETSIRRADLLIPGPFYFWWVGILQKEKGLP